MIVILFEVQEYHFSMTMTGWMDGWTNGMTNDEMDGRAKRWKGA